VSTPDFTKLSTLELAGKITEYGVERRAAQDAGDAAAAAEWAKLRASACIERNKRVSGPVVTTGQISRAQKIKPSLKSYTFDGLQNVQFPRRATLLACGETPILRAGQLAEIYGQRGIGKTLFTRTLALVMASGGSALGFRAPNAVKVCYIDGEMAGEDIQSRDKKLAQVIQMSEKPSIETIAADWQEDYLPRLDTDEGQERVEPFVEDANVVIVDNRSCLFDPEGEKDPTAWQPAQDWLLSLRRRGKGVILVHHANRQGGARGISKSEDVLDLTIKLSPPANYDPTQGARFTLEYDKTRGIPGGADLRSFVAALRPGGWVREGYVATEQQSEEQSQVTLLNSVAKAYAKGRGFKSKMEAVEGTKGRAATLREAWRSLVADGRIVRDGKVWRAAVQPAAGEKAA
jgi:hypothetical protein